MDIYDRFEKVPVRGGIFIGVEGYKKKEKT